MCKKKQGNEMRWTEVWIRWEVKDKGLGGVRDVPKKLVGGSFDLREGFFGKWPRTKLLREISNQISW